MKRPLLALLRRWGNLVSVVTVVKNERACVGHLGSPFSLFTKRQR